MTQEFPRAALGRPLGAPPAEAPADSAVDSPYTPPPPEPPPPPPAVATSTTRGVVAADGEVLLRLRPTRAQAYEVAVSVDELAVPGGRFALTVEPAVPLTLTRPLTLTLA